VFDFGNFGGGLIRLVSSAIRVYMWVVIIRVLVSWISPDPLNPIIQFLRGVTDPVLDRLRRLMPRFFWSTGLDFTPLVLILLLQVVLLGLSSLRFS
jgi:YggT family protein